MRDGTLSAAGALGDYMREASVTSARPTMYPWQLRGLTCGELARHLWNEIHEDEMYGRAAELA